MSGASSKESVTIDQKSTPSEYASKTLWSPWALLTWPLALTGVLLGGVEAFVFWYEGRDPVALILALVVGVPSIWLVARIPFRRVLLTDRSLVYHGVFKRQEIPWPSIKEIELIDHGSNMVGITYYSPSLTLHDGEEIILACLAGYALRTEPASTRAGRQTALIRSRWQHQRGENADTTTNTDAD